MLGIAVLKGEDWGRFNFFFFSFLFGFSTKFIDIDQIID